MGRQPDIGKRRVWERRLRRFQKAGLSALQFCKGEGVSVAALAYWRRKLGRPAPCSRATRSDAAFALVRWFRLAVRRRAGRWSSDSPGGHRSSCLLTGPSCWKRLLSH
jgi:hypothetical protein